MIYCDGRTIPCSVATSNSGGRHEVAPKSFQSCMKSDFAKFEFGEGLAMAMRGSPFIVSM